MPKNDGFMKSAPEMNRMSDELAPSAMDPVAESLKNKRKKLALKRGADLTDLDSMGSPTPKPEDEGY